MVLRYCSLAVALWALTATGARAQYYPPGYVYPPGPGDYLRGQADVMNATGNLFIQQEQARTEREVAEQAKLDTKKKAFDLRLYEKMLTPAYSESRAKDEALLLKRIMSNPLEAEITSGKAQNTMLPLLYNLSVEGISGPPTRIDPQMLKSVNFTIGTGGHSLGMLKDGGALDWPLVVRSPNQKKLAALLPKAVAATADGSLDLAMYNECAKSVTKLQDELRSKFHKEEIDGGMFIEGKRFLDSLDKSVQALRQPTAAKALKGSETPTGRTIPELVDNMTRKGLKFASATPGSEAPYFALYSSMVIYGNSAMDSHAFQAKFAPLTMDQKYYEKSLKSK